MRKVLALSLIMLAVVLAAVTVRLSLPYLQNEFPQILLSFIGPLIALSTGVVLLRHNQGRDKWIAAKWGTFLGAAVFAILQIILFVVHYDDVIEDGVAYWIFVNLTSIYLAPPLCLIGGFLGFLADSIGTRRSKRAIQSMAADRRRV